MNRYMNKKKLTSRIYFHQKNAQIMRGHEKIPYTHSELRDWLFSNELFDSLYESWEESNYDKDLVPSCDRLDNSKGYSFDNMELITWKENKKRAYADAINGKLRTGNKYIPVVQLSRSGDYIQGFFSMSEASRITNTNLGNLRMCVIGKRKTAGDFKWVKKESYGK